MARWQLVKACAQQGGGRQQGHAHDQQSGFKAHERRQQWRREHRRDEREWDESAQACADTWPVPLVWR